MLLLFESAAGFALFKVLKEGKLKESDVRQGANGLISVLPSRCAGSRRALPPAGPLQGFRDIGLGAEGVCRCRAAPGRRARPLTPPCAADRQAEGVQQVREHGGGAGRSHRAGRLQAEQGWVQRRHGARCLRRASLTPPPRRRPQEVPEEALRERDAGRGRLQARQHHQGQNEPYRKAASYGFR